MTTQKPRCTHCGYVLHQPNPKPTCTHCQIMATIKENQHHANQRLAGAIPPKGSSV